MNLITDLTRQAAEAAQVLRVLDETTKNRVLNDMAISLTYHADQILKGNEKDMLAAQQAGLDVAMLDRLQLDAERIRAMAEGIESVAALPDPVGQTRNLDTRPNGLEVLKMRVPLGVVCMIYEARPNVTADASALCFKSGNAVILRGGKEALQSSLAIAKVLKDVLRKHDLPTALVTVVPDPDRAHLMTLMEQRGLIDVIIPRGGEGLINFVTEHSKVPVIQHFKGVCHLFVDKDADFITALKLLVNGKTQRTGVCNALEGLLVHKDIVKDFMPLVAEVLARHGVKVRGCQQTAAWFDDIAVLADHEFGEEFLDLEIAIRVVDGFDQALDHIDRFGSNHTEVICTRNTQRGARFQRSVDASVVMINASSRFSDGSQLGLGAEIGIATTKLHAYGPMGLESLTTEKFLVNGAGQTRA